MPKNPEVPPHDDRRDIEASQPGAPAAAGRRLGTRKRRGLVIGAGVCAAVVAVGVVAAVALNGSGQPVPAGTGSATPQSASATPSAAETPKERAYPPFDRPEYAQIAALPGATATVEPTTVTVSSDDSGATMAEGMMGISFETDVMTDPRFEPGASTLVDELKKLHKPIIRFGGQAVDRRFFWTSSNEPLPGWQLVPAYKGDVRPVVKVTPADLQRLKRMADAADARILVTADLGHFDPDRAADFAKNAAAIFGERLLGITVGNEPNGYHFEGRPYQILRPEGWDTNKFLTEFKAYSAAITKAAPGLKIVGPGAFSENWLQAFVENKDPAVGAVSYHHYPMSDCGTNDDSSPTIDRVMSRKRADLNRTFIGNIAATAKPAGLPVWLTEGGLSACSGSNETTRTHASALWAVGYAMTAASAGITQMDLHGALDACKGGPPMSPICDTGAYKKPNGVITGQANYYAMMLVNAVQPGNFRKLDQTGSQDVYSYAIAHKDGSMSVVIINQNDPKSFAQAPIKIQLPARAATGTMTQMTAPAFDSQDLTRIDGREDAGVPAADRAKVPGFVAGQNTVSLPVTSGTVTVLDFTF